MQPRFQHARQAAAGSLDRHWAWTATGGDPHTRAHAILSCAGEDALIEELGGYRIEGELARGGMGVVYRALDPRSGRRVALKLLLNTDERFRQRFARESQALGRLNHPNVVRVHDAGEGRGAPYLVMELVEGTTLEALLREGPLEVRRAAELVASAARGAGHAHQRGLVHRDIKPDNVLLRPNGQVVLTDFGLARDLEVTSDLSKTGIFMGTPGYASPEQAAGDGKSVGPASDVYGLGALLFALLVGRAPREGSLMEIVVATVTEPAPSARSENPAVDPTLDALCQRCMAKDPADRYRDGDALAEALEAYLRGELEAPHRGIGLVVALGLATLTALGLILVYVLSEGPRPVARPSPRASASRAPLRASPSPEESVPSGPKHSKVLARALRRTAKELDGDALDAAIKSLAASLERVGPASNRGEAQRRLAALYTRRSESLVSRSPAETVEDLRAALALDGSQARRDALSQGLLRQALLVGGTVKRDASWIRAQVLYLEAMELSPADVRPALQFAGQARIRNDLELWLSAGLEAAERAPADERPQIEIAGALVKLERVAEALAGLRRFLQAQPEAKKAWLEVGALERVCQRWSKARQAYERAGGESSQDTMVLEGLAFVALQERRPELALELAERARRDTKRDALAPVRALAIHRSGDSKGALRHYRAAWERRESEPWVCELAQGHLEALRQTKGDADARLTYYLKSGLLGHHARLVLRLIHKGSTERHEGSNQILREIQQLRPEVRDAAADRVLSEWLSRWGTYDLPDFALQLAGRAMKKSATDEDAEALVLAGRALMRLGRHKEAWEALDAALAIQPTRVDLHHVRAELGGSSARYEEGVEAGRRAIELRPRDAYAYVYLSWCLLGLGRSREALPHLDVAKSRLGGGVAGLRALARACAGEIEGAEADLKLARSQDANSTEVRLAEAELRIRAGDRSGGVEVFERVLGEELYAFQRDLIKRALERARRRD